WGPWRARAAPPRPSRVKVERHSASSRSPPGLPSRAATRPRPPSGAVAAGSCCPGSPARARLTIVGRVLDGGPGEVAAIAAAAEEAAPGGARHSAGHVLRLLVADRRQVHRAASEVAAIRGPESERGGRPAGRRSG